MSHPTGEDPIGVGDYASGNYGIAGLRAAADAGEFDWGACLCPFPDNPPNRGGYYQGIPAEEPQRVVRVDRDLRI